ncbi:origin recognition complex subunit 3 N-terminus-domain-containing protein, partial [Lentinula aciculospora]
QTVFYIPFEDDQRQNAEPEPCLPPNLPFDLPNGPEVRWDAYKAAWNKCLNRIQTLVHELYKPIVADVLEKVELAYDDDDSPSLALPHAEIPTIAVTNSSSDAYFLSSVVSQLPMTAHMYPSDCPNITTAMKTLVTGFLSASNPVSTFKSSARTLAAYDINVLVAWYLIQEPDSKPQSLTLLLHDFEEFDPTVVQDVIYICSQHVASLPLILVLSLSSPQSPHSPHSYLHVTYPRSTLKLLRIQSVVAPSGPRILEDIVIKTFVDLSSDSDSESNELHVVPGPAVLEYLAEYATRSNPSVPALLNILQLAHLKHFFTNPLSALVSFMPDVFSTTPTSLKTALRNPASSNFKNLLVERLTADRGDDDVDSDLNSNPSLLIHALHTAYAQLRSRSRSIRLAYFLLQGLHDFLVERGYKGLGTHWERSGTATTPTFTTMASSSSQAAKDIAYARTLLRKLKSEELRAYLDVLIAHLEGLLDADEAYGAYETVDGTRNDDAAYKFKMLNESLAEWMYDYLRTRTTPIDHTPLWDVWYTGSAVFPSETLNPSIRASIVAGLLRPKDFIEPAELNAQKVNNHDSENVDVPLHALPDTSILFHRYLESGKMINTYDWFESFNTVVGVQRREAKAIKEKEKVGRRNKAVGRNVSRRKDKEKERGTAPRKENEHQQLLVQSRFVRALHELDFLGFIKHTKRKPDHVLRTLFEVGD